MTASTDTTEPRPSTSEAFSSFPFGDTDRTIVPSLVYIRPDELDRTVMLAGPDAEAGAENYPVRVTQRVFSNLKSLFKSDLVLSDKDLAWKYKFDRNLGFGETNAAAVAERYIAGLLSACKVPAGRSLYIGKPAYSDLKFERRYEKRIRQIFANLRLSPPKFVYEPYAVYYYCRFLMRMGFHRESSKSGVRILIVDHGGGTINACVVELNRRGEIRSARPKSPQAAHGGGTFIDQFILRKKIREANFTPEVRKHIFEGDRLVLPTLPEVLMQVEKAKIAFAQGRAERQCEVTARLAIPGGPAEWKFVIKQSEIEEAFSYVWDHNCRNAVAAALGSDETKKVDFVILSGGSCRLGFHEKYLRRDFGDYLRHLETTFINVSGEDKPVAYGLCFQALLDESEVEVREQASVAEELREEDLSDYVGHNLLLTIHGEHEGTERVYGEAVLVESGTPKEQLWAKEQRVKMKLWRKPHRAFRFDIHPENQPVEDIHDPEGGTITVRKNMAAEVEKTIEVGFIVNEDGVFRPKFYLSPYRRPSYFEPDKETYKILIPDLAKTKGATQMAAVTTLPAKPSCLPRSDNGLLLGFDFGTSTSCIIGLDLQIGLRTAEQELPFFTQDYIQAVASSEIATESREVRIDDREILRLLEDVDSDLARTYRQVVTDLQSPRYSYKGTAAELRATVELLLDRLAPDEEVQKSGIKPDPVTKRVPYAARATYVLRRRRAGDADATKKCAESVEIIEQCVGNVLRGMHKRASSMVHMGADDERSEVLRMQNYFRALVVDLLE